MPSEYVSLAEIERDRETERDLSRAGEEMREEMNYLAQEPPPPMTEPVLLVQPCAAPFPDESPRAFVIARSLSVRDPFRDLMTCAFKGTVHLKRERETKKKKKKNDFVTTNGDWFTKAGECEIRCSCA